MKKLTAQEKKNRDTFYKSREKKGITFKPLKAVPTQPGGLAIDGLQYYNQCCEAMINDGTLTAAYIPGIIRAAGMVSIYNQALKEIEENGAWQTTKSGYTQKTAAWQVLVDAEKILSAFERGNGLNLIGHSKLPEPPKPDEYNPFDYV